MKNNDDALIQDVLDGDDTAFETLVKKHHKSVHALVWRKIGDFHIAEEITQDTFLKAYQRLSTLKEPQRFLSWLYVIATNRCKAWHRKKRLWTQPLDKASNSELEKAAYSNYVIEQNKRDLAETQRDIVKKLLAKLPESDRTVITLYYLAEMTYEEISNFLGVSEAAIRNRLYRARNKLKKEETMIREALEHFQISPNLTDNIMQEVMRLKPTPSGNKPVIPWAITATSIVLIALMLGIGNQYLAYFQQPYSLEAQTEMSVELVEAPIVPILKTEPDVRHQIGNINAVGKNNSPRQNPDEVLLAAADVEAENEVSVPKQSWHRSKPLKGSMVEGLLATSKRAVYSLSNGHLYKLKDFRLGWEHVSDISSITDVPLVEIPMAEWDNTLYMLPSNILYTSKDDGKTWDIAHEFPKEFNFPKELLLTKQAFYIIYEIHGAFRSKDKGQTWKNINDEFTSKPDTIVTVQDNVFANDGYIFRWTNESWQRLEEFPVPDAKICYSIAASNGKLYAFALNPQFDPDKASEGQRGWWIFRTTDMGNSWKDITPKGIWKSRVGWAINIRLIAAGDILLAIEQGIVRSTDAGNTWMPLQAQHEAPSMFSNSPAAALNEQTLYFGSWDYGLQRSTDRGKSWDIVNLNRNKSGIWEIKAVKGINNKKDLPTTIYGRVGDMVKTTDQGRSWKTIPTDMSTITWRKENPPTITQIVQSSGDIYAKGHRDINTAYDYGQVHIYRLTTDGNTLNPLQDMPVLKDSPMMNILPHRKTNLTDIEFAKQLQEKAAGATQFFIQLAQMRRQTDQKNLRRYGLIGPFAVSGDTFYIEYNFKLFRWEIGNTEWQNIGLEETVELTLEIARKELKLTVSGDTVYVGKRDGHLHVSFDKGNTWIDLTPALPFPIKVFKEIVVAGTRVFVATDAGIITTEDGKSWNTLTDAEGTNLIMDMLTVDGTTLYGVIKDTGIYRLESGTWKNVVSKIPERATSLAVDGETLYVGTETHGMLFYTLE